MLKDLSTQWMSNFIVAGLSFFSTVAVARVLGPETFGEYAVALSVGAVAAIIIDSGMRTLLLRERAKSSAHLNSITTTIFGLAQSHVLFSSALLGVLAIVFVEESYRKLALATIGCFTALTLTQLVSATMRGDGKFQQDAWFLIGARATAVSSILIGLLIGVRSPWQILALWGSVTLLYLLFFFRFFTLPKLSGLERVYRAALPFLILELSITVYILSDVLLLGVFGVEADLIGAYSAAFRICEVGVLLSAPVGLLFFHHMRTNDRPREYQYQLIINILKLSILASLPIVIVIGYFAPQLIHLIFGENFSGAGSYLQILSGMLLFILPNAILTQAAIALGKEKYSIAVAFVAAVLNLTLLAIFISIFGVTSAAWIKVITEGFVVLSMSVLLLSNRKTDSVTGQKK